MNDDGLAVPSYEQPYNTLIGNSSTNSLAPAPQQASLKGIQQHSINHLKDPILVNEESSDSDNSDNVVSWKKTTKPTPNQSGQATIFSCVVSLGNSVLGSGILAVPYAFSRQGWLVGSISLLIFGALAVLGVYLMMKTSRYKKDATFSDLGYSLVSRRTMYVIDSITILGNCGALIGYLIVVGDLMPVAIDSIFNDVPEILRKRGMWISLCVLLFVVPLVPSTTFDKLRHFSTFAMLCFTYVFVAALAYKFLPDNVLDSCTKHIKNEHDHCRGSISTTPKNLIDMVSVFPIFVFAFGCVQNSVPITHELSNNTDKRLFSVSLYTIIICFIIIH